MISFLGGKGSQRCHDFTPNGGRAAAARDMLKLTFSKPSKHPMLDPDERFWVEGKVSQTLCHKHPRLLDPR